MTVVFLSLVGLGGLYQVPNLDPAPVQPTQCSADGVAAGFVGSAADVQGALQCLPQIPGSTQAPPPAPAIPTTVSEKPSTPAPYVTRACDEHGGNLNKQCLRSQSAQCNEKPGGFFAQLMVPNDPQDPNTGYTRQGARFCQYPSDPGRPAFPGFSERDFRSLGILSASIGSQPGRHTLKGAETNIYSEASEQNFTVDVVGYKVDVRATPSEYHWDYGDGTSLITAVPGGPIPESRWGEKTVTSHVYRQTGDFNVNLTTVFTGEFSVDGGPYQPIVGNAPIPSAPRTLSVWRSEVKLYADDCNVNPQGAGCQ